MAVGVLKDAGAPIEVGATGSAVSRLALRRPVARTDKNIDLAAHDIDGDGRAEAIVETDELAAQRRRRDDGWRRHCRL